MLANVRSRNQCGSVESYQVSCQSRVVPSEPLEVVRRRTRRRRRPTRTAWRSAAPARPAAACRAATGWGNARSSTNVAQSLPRPELELHRPHERADELRAERLSGRHGSPPKTASASAARRRSTPCPGRRSPGPGGPGTSCRGRVAGSTAPAAIRGVSASSIWSMSMWPQPPDVRRRSRSGPSCRPGRARPNWPTPSRRCSCPSRSARPGRATSRLMQVFAGMIAAADQEVDVRRGRS